MAAGALASALIERVTRPFAGARLGRLQRHVLGEFLRSLALAAGVFTGFFVLMVALSLEGQARRFVTDVATLAWALPYIMPYILCFSLPLAFLVAAVLAFGKLAGAGEIAAMRASGVRLTTVTGPVLALALLSALPIVFLVDTGMEWGFGRATELIMESGRASILSRAGSGTTLKVDASGRSFRIHRFGTGPDGREPLAVVEFSRGAPRQVVLARDHDLDAEGVMTVRSTGGDGAQDKEYDLLRFRMGGGPAASAGFAWAMIADPGEVVLARSGEFTIAAESASLRRRNLAGFEWLVGLSQNVREAKELGGKLPSLEGRGRDAKAARLRRVEMEIHRKISFAFGPLALVLLGIPLGLRLGRAGFSVLLLGIVVVLAVYYLIWFSGQGLAISGVLPASVSVWMANALAGAVGAVWLSGRTG